MLTALVIDQIFDNLISPRIMADALKVHPAGVLVMALVAANLLGILGVVIAAPILATLQLIGKYVLRKMFDQNPWPEAEPEMGAQPVRPLVARLRPILDLLRRMKGTPSPEIDSPDSQIEDQPKGE